MVNPDLNNNDENPYDFIFKQERSAVPAGGGPNSNRFGSNNRQMLIFGGFVFGVLFIIAIAFTIITSANKDEGLEAISVQAYQTEIRRVLEAGNKNIADGNLMKKLVTLELTLLTDQSKVAGILAKKGVQPSQAQLAQYQRSANDSALTNSLQVDRHDEVFEEVIDELVGEYYNAISTAQSAARTNNELASLTQVRESVDVIYNLNQEEETQSEDTTPETSVPAN